MAQETFKKIPVCLDPIIPDETDRCRYLRYKFENGQMLRQINVSDGSGKLLYTLAFQEDENIPPEVGDEALRIDYTEINSTQDTVTCTMVTVTQGMIDGTIPQTNLAPTDIAISNATVPANISIGDTIGELSTFDPNVGDTHTYTILSDPDDKFEISGNLLRLKNLMDTNSAHTHDVTIRSTDQGLLFYDKLFTIVVTDVTEFANDKATLFQGDTFDMYMDGPASSTILPGNGSFTTNFWIKKDNPVITNDYSLAFNGTDERVDTPIDLSGRTALTISGWTYRDLTTERIDISQSNSGNTLRIKFVRNNNGSCYVVLGAIAQQYTDITVGWHHYAVTFDGTVTNNDRLKLYRDGVLQTPISIPAGIPTAVQTIADNLTIGYDRGAGTYSSGRIDEVSIWDTTLTLLDVTQIYNNQAPTELTNHAKSANLLHWYRMGDVLSGATVPDQAGASDGTLVNMDNSNRAAALAGDAPSEFLPDSISGLDVWLDANDAATITESAGKVSQWDDKSGNGNNAVQGVGANQPALTTNGYGVRNTIGFDTLSYLSTAYATNTDTTIITVFKHNHGVVQPAGPVWQIDPTNSVNGFFPQWIDNNQYVGVAGSSWMTKASEIIDDTFYNTTVVYNSTAPSSELYLDNVLNDSNATVENTGTAFTLGWRQSDGVYFKGQVAEVLIYNKVLSTLERDQIEDYLNTKWVLGQNITGLKTLMSIGKDIGEVPKIEIKWNESNKLAAYIYDINTTNTVEYLATGNWANNEYRMVTLRYDSILQTASFCVDDIILDTESVVAGATGNAPFLIATGDVVSGPFYDGLMDEVSIWNSAITVSNLYAGGFATDISLNPEAAFLASWYRMGDPPDNFLNAGGIVDASGNSNNLTAYNMSSSNCVTDSVPPVAGYENTSSLPFNGIDQYGDTGISTDLLSSDLSVSIWYKGTSPNYIISQGDALAGYSSQWIIGGASSLFWVNTVTIGSLTAINDDIWHNLVFSWTTATNRYTGYLDGVNLGLSPVATPNTAVTNVMLCTRGDTTTAFNQGKIDELSIWNKALDDTEVTELYNAGVPTDLNEHTTTANLTNWYRMGEDTNDTETTVIDQKGNSNMTLSNFLSGPYDTDVPT